MLESATSVARLVWRALCATLALALGLTCTVLVVAIASGMTSMTDKDVGGMSMVASPTTTATALSVTVADATPSGAAAAKQVLTSACDHSCAGGTTGDLCMVATGFLLTSALALLLASPRSPYLGWLTRVRRPGLRRRRLRRRTPWLVISPVSLCVLRI